MSNLAYQLQAGFNFTEGIKKAIYYNQHGRDVKDKIFSYSELDRLKDMAKQFGRWEQKNHSEIKFAKNIPQEHVQEFLNKKAETCTSNTLRTYKASLEKIQVLTNNKFKDCKLDWNLQVPACKKDATRNIAFKREEVEKIIENANDCESLKGVRIAAELGLRASEIVHLKAENINYEEKTIDILKAKGGRDRTLPLNDRQLELFRELSANKLPVERLVKVKADSINRWLAVQRELNGIDSRYADAKTGIHSLRKMVAQERYDELRNAGYDKQDAENMVNRYLGHSEGRSDVIERYVENAW